MAAAEEDTVVERSATGATFGATKTTDAGAESPTTSAVLHAQEVARARAFFRLMTAVVGVVVSFVPWLPGPPVVRVYAAGFGVASALLCGFVVARLRDPSHYTPRLVIAVGIGCSIAAGAVLYYLGLFSAAAMVLTVGIYFFGLSESRLAAVTIYTFGTALYFALSAGVASGVLPDVALYSIASVPPVSRWFVVVMAQIVFATTFYLARSSRRATEEAIERAYRANLRVRQRDALLAEARIELDRALEPGEGRFSGETVGGYRLGAVLGRGAMGEVYRAVHVETGRTFALKLLHPNVLEDPDQVKRFLREATAASKVQSRHVAEVHEVGATPSGVPYFAMELVEGHDLAWHLRKTSRLPLPQVVELVEHAARALAAVREAGIVHRDMKPQNLVLDGRTRLWKVLDFGVSKVAGGSGTLTRGAVVGTPAYMAPEQARGEDCDHRADLYALAAVAYRAITGKPAFAGNDSASVLYAVVFSQPSRPGELVRIPPDVELVLAIGLAKRPLDRFATVEELALALRKASTGELDEATRARGRALVEEFPWGKPIAAGAAMRGAA